MEARTRMTPEKQERISKWNSRLSHDIEIGLVLSDDKRSVEFMDFCDRLTRLAPRVRVVQEEGEPREAPAIRILPGLRYHAIPGGTELEPFLETLSFSQEASSPLPASIQNDLENVDLPAALKLYVSQQCPFCPATTRQLVPLVSASDLIQLSIIDCALFPEMVQSNKIQSVPTVLLDEQWRWTGSLQLDDLVEIIANRDPTKLSTSALQRMLKEGNAFQITEMMLDKQHIFPAFFDLLTHEKMFIRLGAMAVMEEITERSPRLAAQVVEPLWERFDRAGDQVRGDIIHILGESGNKEITPRLEEILDGSYPAEVKEATQEALEKIEQYG